MTEEPTPQDQRFKLSPDERAFWNENGYLVRLNVFTPEENDAFRQVAEDIVDRKRPFPTVHIDQNALVRDGKAAQQGIYAMHKIHFPSCYDPEFLARVRDPRLTDPLVDLLGPDILGINTLFIWKAPKIGLGFRGIKISSISALGLGQRQLLEHGRLSIRQIKRTVVSTLSPVAINGTSFSTTTSKAHNNENSSWHAVFVMRMVLR